MKFAFAAAALVALAAFSTSAEAAGPRARDWSINLSAGTDIPINGSMHGGLTATVPDLGPLFPAFAGQSGDLAITSRSYDDFYGSSPIYRIALLYALSDTLELFVDGSHTEADSRRVQVGTAAVPSGAATTPLYATFSRYRAQTLEAGARLWLGEPDDRLRPYAAGRIGAARSDAISSTFDAGGASSIAVPFYNETTTYTAGVDFGLAMEVARIRAINAAVELGAEVGFRYIGELDQNDSALSVVGAQNLNEKSGRLSAPISLTLRMRFGAGDD